MMSLLFGSFHLHGSDYKDSVLYLFNLNIGKFTLRLSDNSLMQVRGQQKIETERKPLFF